MLVCCGLLMGAVTTVATGCADFEITPPRLSGAKVIRAADYGFSAAGTKNAAALNRAVGNCRGIGPVRLVLEPGVYRCFDEDGVRIEGMKDFELDGCGATLVFRRPPEYRGQPQSERIPGKANMLVRDCERVEIRNLSMDWDWASDPLAVAVACVGRHLDERDNASYFDLKLVDLDRHPKYPEPVPVQRIQAFDAANLRFVPGEQWYFGQSEGHFGAKNEWIAPNVLRVWPCVTHPGRNENPLMGNWHSPALNRDGVKRMKEGATYRLQHCYYGKNGLYLHANRHLTVRGVRILSAFGMGVVVDGEQEYWQLVDFSLAPPEGMRRPISSTADGLHVVRSKGHCRCENCLFSLNNDDSMNFHDRFTLAIPVASNALEIINRRGEEYVSMAVGDTLELRNPDFSATGFRTRLVRKAGELNQGNLLYVDRELPPMRGRCFLVWDRNYGTDDVIVRNCSFVDTASRNLFSPSNLTIEDCVFRRTGRHPISLVADYRMSRWCEGFGSTNIVIRGCLFEDNCTLSRGIPEISTHCTTPDGWDVGKVDSGFVGGGMLIEKCRFVRPGGAVLDLPIGRDIVFRKSKICPSVTDRGLKRDAESHVLVRGAENVVVRDVSVE